MRNCLSKQLILLFVLPPAIIIPAIILMTLLSVKVGWIVIAALSGVIVWMLFLYAGSKRLSKEWDPVDKAIQDLQEGKPIDKQKSPASGMLDSLEKVSVRMMKQRDELRQERVNRLRSVIDGQDQERHRLSRELHDGVGQSLIAVKLQLESAANLSYSQMRASVDVAMGMIDQSIDEVRKVTNTLLPAALNEFGLITALRARCEEMANAAGIQVSFVTTGSVERLDSRSQTYLYRIAQEAITNTIKHARASRLDIQIHRAGPEVILLVSDNGKGFIFDPVSYAHRNGIQNIRERVALLNGTFDLRSQPEKGTQLKITIPYKTANGKHSNHPGR